MRRTANHRSAVLCLTPRCCVCRGSLRTPTSFVVAAHVRAYIYTLGSERGCRRRCAVQCPGCSDIRPKRRVTAPKSNVEEMLTCSRAGASRRLEFHVFPRARAETRPHRQISHSRDNDSPKWRRVHILAVSRATRPSHNSRNFWTRAAGDREDSEWAALLKLLRGCDEGSL